MQAASKSMNLDFSVRWKPYFLDASLPGGNGKDKLSHYNSKFGAARVAQMMPQMVRTFEEEGIPGYCLEGRVGNTLDSHRLMEFALRTGGPEKQTELCLELFDRYFLQGKPLSSRKILLEAAANAKLDGAEAMLESEAFSDEVWSEVERAKDAGVDGVPHFVIDGGGRGKELVGAQDADAFLQIFRSLAPAPSSSPTVTPGSSDTAIWNTGSQICVLGLKSQPALNGKFGVVMGKQGGRIQVRLTDGKELAVKPTNLKNAPAKQGLGGGLGEM